jgi:hypothetical protein
MTRCMFDRKKTYEATCLGFRRVKEFVLGISGGKGTRWQEMWNRDSSYSIEYRIE